MQRSKSGRAGFLVLGLMASAWSTMGTAGVDAASRGDVGPLPAAHASTGIANEMLRATRDDASEPSPAATFRVAKKYKYEIPKAERAATPQDSTSKSQQQTPQATAPQYTPAPAPAVRSPPSRRSPQGNRVRRAPVTDFGGSCEGCRAACYNRWRLNCGTSSACTQGFVPCMRSCWSRLCRG